MFKRKAGILKVLVLDGRAEFIEQIKDMLRPYRHVRVEAQDLSENHFDHFNAIADLIIVEFTPTLKLIEKLGTQKCPIVFVSHDMQCMESLQLDFPSAGFASMPLDPASFLGEVNQLVRLAG